MKESFYKFPSTPHLVTPVGVDIRDDKVMTEPDQKAFMKHELTVEEKIDGANLGISFDAHGNICAQNRGSFLQFPVYGQWKKLEHWLTLKTDSLFECLTDEYILFGEWCYAKHSVSYGLLPDWFIGFDIFDKNAEKFISSDRRNVLLKKMEIVQIPLIAKGIFSLSNLDDLLSRSRFGKEPAEGIYLRFDKGEWLEQRAKLVRAAFVQTIGNHWSRSELQSNRLSHEPKKPNGL